MNNDECPESEYGHAWIAGMMRVHDEDVEVTARERAKFRGVVTCERCDYTYQVKS